MLAHLEILDDAFQGRVSALRLGSLVRKWRGGRTRFWVLGVDAGRRGV